MADTKELVFPDHETVKATIPMGRRAYVEAEAELSLREPLRGPHAGMVRGTALRRAIHGLADAHTDETIEMQPPLPEELALLITAMSAVMKVREAEGSSINGTRDHQMIELWGVSEIEDDFQRRTAAEWAIRAAVDHGRVAAQQPTA